MRFYLITGAVILVLSALSWGAVEGGFELFDGDHHGHHFRHQW